MPQTDPTRRMAPAQVDDALVPLTLPGILADRDGIRTLHDAAEPVEIGCVPRHAPVAQALVLRPVVAVHAAGVVEGAKLNRRRDGGPHSPPAQPRALDRQVSVLRRSLRRHSRWTSFCRRASDVRPWAPGLLRPLAPSSSLFESGRIYARCQSAPARMALQLEAGPLQIKIRYLPDLQARSWGSFSPRRHRGAAIHRRTWAESP